MQTVEMRLFHKTYATYFNTEFSSKTASAVVSCMWFKAYESYQLQILVQTVTAFLKVAELREFNNCLFIPEK